MISLSLSESGPPAPAVAPDAKEPLQQRLGSCGSHVPVSVLVTSVTVTVTAAAAAVTVRTVTVTSWPGVAVARLAGVESE